MNNIKYLSITYTYPLKGISVPTVLLYFSRAFMSSSGQFSKIQRGKRREILFFLSFPHKLEDIRNPQMILIINGPRY